VSYVRLTTAWVLALILVVPSAPIMASHGDNGCGRTRLNQGARDADGDNSEDGASAEIRVNYPGPPAQAYVKTLFVWLSMDNWVEVGWVWVAGFHSSPRTIAAWTDAGNYNDMERVTGSLPYAGDLNTYPEFRVVNLSGKSVTWYRNQQPFYSRTMTNLDRGNVAGNVEAWAACDSAYAHYRNTRELEPGGGWSFWDGTVRWRVGTQNPCYHTRVVDNTAWYSEHGPDSGETCP
jgi:hypothetical protein